MADSSPRPAGYLDRANVTYEDVRIVIEPEAPRHYEVKVSEREGDISTHAVERVVVNTAEVALDDPIWFVDVKVDVGVAVDEPGDTVWVWA